jgi:ABC-type branched-subunit amino acid transport system substrate-binding protein
MSNYVLNYKEDVTGVIFPTIFFGDDKADTVQNFMKKYQETYGVVPNIMSATSYDLMKIMCDILTNKDKKIDSREQFKNELLGVKDYMGITGKFSFYVRGAPLKEYYILKIDDSGFKPLGKMIGD